MLGRHLLVTLGLLDLCILVGCVPEPKAGFTDQSVEVNPNCAVNPIGSAFDPAIGPPSTAALKQLAPQDVLTIGVNTSNNNIGLLTNGVLSGTAIDVACRLAAKLNLPLQFTAETTSPNTLGQDYDANTWNIGFAADPTNSAISVQHPNDSAALANAYVSIENTYMVPTGSSFQTIADVDKMGVKIGVQFGNADDIFLTANIHNATIVRFITNPLAFNALKNGQVNVTAAGRPALANFIISSWTTNGVAKGRTLVPNLFVANLGPVMHQGSPDAICYLSDFVEGAKASGLIQQAIKRTVTNANPSTAGRLVAPPQPTCTPNARIYH